MKIALVRICYNCREDSSLGTWLALSCWNAARDPRIDKLEHVELVIPDIPTAYNRAVVVARRLKADVLLTFDAEDMVPHSGWLPSVVDFFFHPDNLDRPWVLLAPYMRADGVNMFAPGEDDSYVVEYDSETAFKLTGIQPVHSGGVGCAAFDMRAFESVEPPWFSWGWADKEQSEIKQTQDIYCLTNLGRAGVSVFCHWGRWACHRKGILLGKPD